MLPGVILILQEAAEYYLVSLQEDTNLCDPCKACNHDPQGYSVSLLYLWRASSLLRSSSSPKSVLVFLLIVGCVGYYQCKEGNVTGDNIV